MLLRKVNNWIEIFECNLNAKDAATYCSLTEFWGQVFMYWCEFNFHEPQTNTAILQQKLWFNSHLRINNKPIFWKKWVTAGVTTVEDIINTEQDKSFKSLRSLRDQYGLVTSWLEYQQIKNCLPDNWKKTIKIVKEENSKISNIESLRTAAKPCNAIYKQLIDYDCHLIKYADRWKHCMGEVEPDRYKNSFRNIYVMTKITKLRDFQYCLLLGKIPTNTDLYKWKKLENDNCTLCRKGPEGIFHLLLNCPESQKIWKQVCQALNINMLEITKEIILFNDLIANPKNVCNAIILVVKQLIYRCRCLKKKPTKSKAREELIMYYNIEKFKAKMKEQLDNFYIRWGAIDMHKL